ncbi:hypothetical protein GQX74_010865, partial [Glossina fuscipes]
CYMSRFSQYLWRECLPHKKGNTSPAFKDVAMFILIDINVAIIRVSTILLGIIAKNGARKTFVCTAGSGIWKIFVASSTSATTPNELSLIGNRASSSSPIILTKSSVDLSMSSILSSI